MSSRFDDAPCVICGSVEWQDLPELGPTSMLSDLRVMAAPLGRRACRTCGLVAARQAALDAGIFTSGYQLYAHAPDDARDHARQRQYAGWLAAAVGPRVPRAVLDVGCGNGSLLRALAECWPDTDRFGCDLSVDSVRHGREAGLRLWASEASGLPAEIQADLVVSVNVIEHTSAPAAFLRSLRDRVAEGGRLALVCPNGAQPDVELLIADHLHSFTREHLDRLLRDSGFTMVGWSQAPEALGAFQLVVAEAATTRGTPAPFDPQPAVVAAKASYLRSWANLDTALFDRTGRRPLTCFGMGEAAGLLRAYAPRTWALVAACTADQLPAADFGGVPAVHLADAPIHQAVLVAVRTRDQERVAASLRARFPTVVTWYDLVASDALSH